MTTTTRQMVGLILFAITLVVFAMLIDSSRETQNQEIKNQSEIQGTFVETTTTVDLSWMNTTTTTAQPVAATTDGCWTSLAREVGWPEHTLSTLQHIIQRESGCDPNAYANRPSTLDNSRGLLQINAYGNLADGIRRLCGIEPATLFDPKVNLECGLIYWQSMGWSPWRLS